MKKCFGLFILSLILFKPSIVRASAMDLANYPLQIYDKILGSETYKNALAGFEKAKEMKEKTEAAKEGMSNPTEALSGVANEVFKEKSEAPAVPASVAEVADDEEAVKDEIINLTNIEVTNKTENLTEEIEKLFNNRRDMNKLNVFEAYAAAISNRALVSEIRIKLNDLQENLYSSKDVMGTYKVIPEISEMTARELQKIIYLETVSLSEVSQEKLYKLPIGFKDAVIKKDKEEGEE